MLSWRIPRYEIGEKRSECYRSTYAKWFANQVKNSKYLEHNNTCTHRCIEYTYRRVEFYSTLLAGSQPRNADLILNSSTWYNDDGLRQWTERPMILHHHHHRVCYYSILLFIISASIFHSVFVPSNSIAIIPGRVVRYTETLSIPLNVINQGCVAVVNGFKIYRTYLYLLKAKINVLCEWFNCRDTDTQSPLKRALPIIKPMKIITWRILHAFPSHYRSLTGGGGGHDDCSKVTEKHILAGTFSCTTPSYMNEPSSAN